MVEVVGKMAAVTCQPVVAFHKRAKMTPDPLPQEPLGIGQLLQHHHQLMVPAPVGRAKRPRSYGHRRTTTLLLPLLKRRKKKRRKRKVIAL